MNEFDLRSLWAELDLFEAENEKEAKLLQDIWVKIGSLKLQNEKDFEKLSMCPEYDFVSGDTLVILNISGQIVELPAEILCRDPASVLASYCRKSPPAGQREVHFIDRDSWIFRHILNYLRDDTLPSELDTLKELYREASFFKLSSLQRAIEELPVGRISRPQPGY